MESSEGLTRLLTKLACVRAKQSYHVLTESRAVPNLPAEWLQSPRVPAARAGGDESRLGLSPRHKCIRIPLKIKAVAQLFVLGGRVATLRRKI